MDLIDDIPCILMAEPSILLFLLCLANNKVQNDNIFYKKLYYYAAEKVTLNNDNRPEPQLHVETVLETTNLHPAGCWQHGDNAPALQNISMRTSHKAKGERRANLGSWVVQTLLLQQCWQAARQSMAFQPGWQRSHPKRLNSPRGTSENPASNAEPSSLWRIPVLQGEEQTQQFALITQH